MGGPIPSLINKLGTSCNLFEAFRRELLVFICSPVAFTTFFVTLGPIEAAAMFAALTQNRSTRHRRAMAIRGTLVATGILLIFAIFGDWLLGSLGISLAALRTAGGILLLLIGIDMVFARSSGGTTTTEAETQEAEHKQDISVFPLAAPPHCLTWGNGSGHFAHH